MIGPRRGPHPNARSLADARRTEPWAWPRTSDLPRGDPALHDGLARQQRFSDQRPQRFSILGQIRRVDEQPSVHQQRPKDFLISGQTRHDDRGSGTGGAAPNRAAATRNVHRMNRCVRHDGHQRRQFVHRVGLSLMSNVVCFRLQSVQLRGGMSAKDGPLSSSATQPMQQRPRTIRWPLGVRRRPSTW